MSKKTELQKEAKDLGIKTEGLSVSKLEKAITDKTTSKEFITEESSEDQEIEVIEVVIEDSKNYNLSELKKADNVRLLIDYTNGRIGDEKVIDLLDKVFGFNE